MGSDSEDSNLSSLKSDWVQDALKLQQAPRWVKRLSISLTAMSCLLYSCLFFLISGYQLKVAESIRELPIFTRVVLNIYQPFLIVFMLISLSLLILLKLKIKNSRWSYKPVVVLIMFNSLFAATLLIVSVVKVF